MGCFDSTCSISGIPIKEGDAVRWGLISPGKCSHHPETPLYPCQSYQFWTPILSSTYNDYGSIELNDIKETEIWDWFWNKFKTRIISEETSEQLDQINIKDIKFVQNKRNSKEKNEQLFQDLISQRSFYLPSGYHFPKPVKVFIWMTHTWAFDYIKNIQPRSSSQIDDYMEYVFRILDPFSAEKIKGLDEESILKIASESANKRMNLEKWMIEGEQGFMLTNVHIDIDNYEDGFDTIKDQYKEILIESMDFIHNLYFVRKVIMPMYNNGEQHDRDLRDITNWQNFLANKCKEIQTGFDNF